MFTIEVPSWTFFVCSASRVSIVKASRPHASATQIEWMPAWSAIFARSINALKSSLPCQLMPIVSLRAMASSCGNLLCCLAQIAHALIPALEVGMLLGGDREKFRIEREKEKRMIHRRVGHREILPQEEFVLADLRIDHLAVARQFDLARRLSLAHLRGGHPDQLLAVGLERGIAGRIEQVGNDQEQDRREQYIVGEVIQDVAQPRGFFGDHARLGHLLVDPS